MEFIDDIIAWTIIIASIPILVWWYLNERDH